MRESITNFAKITLSVTERTPNKGKFISAKIGLLCFLLSFLWQPLATAQILLNNTSEFSESWNNVEIGYNAEAAAPFTTGTAITATAISVNLVMGSINGYAPTSNNFVVQIWGATTGGFPDPTNVIATLSGNTNPSTPGTYTYTGTASWTSGQNLFIVCTAPTETVGAWRWQRTSSSTINTTNGYTDPLFRTYQDDGFGAGYSQYVRFLFSMEFPTPQNALHFDGSDFVATTYAPSFSNNFTIEAWVNPTATTVLSAEAISGFNALAGGTRYLIFPTFRGDDAGVGIAVGTNGISVAEHGNSHAPTVLSWAGSISGWTHIAVVCDNKQYKLYVNGALTHTGQTSIKTNVFPSLGEATTGIGGGPWGYYEGSVDELRVWSSVRTTTELLANSACPLTGSEPNLDVYYNFDQGTAGGSNAAVTTLPDLTSNGINGTLNNFALSGSTSNWIAGLVGASTAPTVTISETYISATTTTNLTATPTLGGTNPTYQWTLNSANVGTNSATYTASGLQVGDIIGVTMTSNSSCASPLTATDELTLVSGVLPVEMLYFRGEAFENGNLLTWATASEEDNAGFEVQKSTDGRTFEKIGFVAGNGTAYEQQTYEFLDENIANATAYYRLKQLDFNNKFEFSNIVFLSNKGTATADVLIYPNPVQDVLTIENAEGFATIYNTLGQPLRQIEINNTKYFLSTDDLPKGIYTLHVRRADGTAVVKQFLK
jgi:hypothetical protein